MTAEMSQKDKQKTAIKVTIAVIISSFAMFFFGKYIFALFGITLDAFRIGAGSILFLSAVSMINDVHSVGDEEIHTDIAVVPLAIPITVGPGVIGVLMVMGAEPKNTLELLAFSAALAVAGLSIGVILIFSNWMQRFLGEKSIVILQKTTGLFVSAIAAQIVFTGIQGFL